MPLGAEPEQVQELVTSAARLFRVEVIQAADELEVFVRGERVVEYRLLGDIADASFGLERLLDHVESRDRRASAVGEEQSGENFHRRRLARAVGAEEAED